MSGELVEGLHFGAEIMHFQFLGSQVRTVLELRRGREVANSKFYDELEAKWAAEDDLYALPPQNDTLPLLFLPRVMNESVLPRKRTQNREVERIYRNLSMRVRTIDNGPLPYGVVARKLLLFFSTRAIQEQSRSVALGMSERELMDHLGIARNHKASRHLRNQVRRLSKLTVEIDYRPKDGKRIEYQGVVFSQIVLERDEEQLPLWASEVVFSQDYYAAIGKRANPYHTSQIAALESAFALDLFLWLALRLPTASRDYSRLSFEEHLAPQFCFPSSKPSARPYNKYVFSKSISRALQSIYRVWPASREAVKWCGKSYTLKIRYCPDLVSLKEQAGW